MKRSRILARFLTRFAGRKLLPRHSLFSLCAAATILLLLSAGCDALSGVKGFELDQTSATLYLGQTAQLAIVSDSTTAASGATWSSDKPLIASVSATGLVTALTPGAAVITATSGDGKETAACAVAIPNIQLVDSNITSSETWVTGRTYYVNGGRTLTSGTTLTIQPGTIVKFGTDCYLSANGGASINATGTGVAADKAIVFTSFKDASVGTAIPGVSGAAAKGDWLYVAVYGTGNKFEYCVFSYGGAGTPVLVAGAATDSGGTITVNHCVFRDNKGAPNDPFAAALDTSYAGAGSMITNNVFYGNEWPLIVGIENDLDDSNIFHNPDDATVVNAYQGVYIGGYYSVQWAFTANHSLTIAEVPIATNKEIWVGWVGSPATLTVGPNTAFKFMADGWMVVSLGATLSYADATTVFTSILDDSVKGDTDGASTPAAADGDWAGIKVITGDFVDDYVWRAGTAVRYDYTH